MTNAYISITNYGSEEEKHELAENLAAKTPYLIQGQAYGDIVLCVPLEHVGDFAKQIVADEKLCWIEYTVQFAD